MEIPSENGKRYRMWRRPCLYGKGVLHKGVCGVSRAAQVLERILVAIKGTVGRHA